MGRDMELDRNRDKDAPGAARSSGFGPRPGDDTAPPLLADRAAFSVSSAPDLRQNASPPRIADHNGPFSFPP